MIRKCKSIILPLVFVFGFSLIAYSKGDGPGPVCKHATAKTKALFRNLIKLSADGKTMFGHQDDTAYGIGWNAEEGQSDTKRVTGQYPAVYGWELGHLELGDSVSLDSVSFGLMRKLIRESYERGGVNTISWHLRNPLTGGSSWDVSSSKVVASILPGGAKHDLYKAWLDRLATFLGSLKDTKGNAIPVLFRPFHEHTGSWFWWGSTCCSAEEYKSLVRFTISYLVKEKKLSNVLTVYSPDLVKSEQEYWERYPGDEYIDILGLDLYSHSFDEGYKSFSTYSAQTMGFLKDAAKKRGKAFVFSETGCEGLVKPEWFTQYLYKVIEKSHPAYVLVWRNAWNKPNHFYVPYPGHPACEDFIRFKNYKDILFGSELPNMYR